MPICDFKLYLSEIEYVYVGEPGENRCQAVFRRLTIFVRNMETFYVIGMFIIMFRKIKKIRNVKIL